MKRIISLLLMLAIIGLCGCSQQKEQEVKEPTDREILEDIVGKISSDTSTYNEIFNDNKLEELINNSSSSVKEFYLDVLSLSSLKDYKDGTMTLTFPDETKLVEIACSDKNGFVQDYNNFVSINMTDSELEEFVYDYLCKLLKDKSVETKEISYKISDSFKIGKKLDSSSYYVEALTGIKQGIDSTLPDAVADVSREDKETGSIASLKLGYNYVLTNYTEVLDEKNNVTVNEQKYLLNIKEVIGREKALEEVYSLSESNKGLSISNDAKVFMVKYDVTNTSDEKLILDNEFYLASEDNKLYVTSGFRVSGLLSETALSPGETKTLKVLLIGDSDRIVHYNSISKIMYNIDLANDLQGTL